MKRVLCVRFPNWSIQRLQRELQPDASPALALHTGTADSAASRSRNREVQADLKYVRSLFPAARNGPAVVAVSEQAWMQGVRPGLPLAEARSMASPPSGAKSTAQGNVDFCEWSPLDDRAQLVALAEPLRRFAPTIGLDTMPIPDCLLLDVTGCGSLFGGESVLAEELLREIRSRGYFARVCISDSVAAAWAFTHADGHSIALKQRQPNDLADAEQISRLPVLIVPPGQHLEYAAPLPLSAARLLPADTSVLSQLGLLTIRGVLNLPREDLPSRLSPDATMRLRQLLGVETEVIEPLPEADPVIATWSSEFPVTTRDELRQVIDHLIAQIVDHLARRRCGCIRLTCLMHSGNDESERVTADVVKPVTAAEMLTEVLSLRLDAIALRSEINRVALSAVVAPLPASRQKDLFSATEHIVPQEELATLINRLSGRLGNQSVLLPLPNADARPEHAVRLKPVFDQEDPHAALDSSDNALLDLVTPHESPSPTSSAALNRPLRLLPVAQRLDIPHTTQSPVNATITIQGRRHRISSATGPERIQTAWWSDQPAHRDYFRISTDEQSQFWIYRDLQNNTWYLHGIFD